MKKFLEPESVVVIGASRRTGSGAYNGIEMMLRYGYEGRIYPINPKAEEICGIKTFPAVAGVPEVADLAVISVGRDRAISAFEDCIAAGIRRIILITQGFGDADRRGRDLQDHLNALARAHGVRFLGPNTLGVVNNFRNFSTGFIDLPRPEKVLPVSLIAQSGLFQVASREFSYHTWGKSVDVGNAGDVDFVDVLEYFGDDPDTEVIALYMEGFLRGREFLKIASSITRRKPIVVLKSGRTQAGARAALSHTGSLVGGDDVNDAVFRRAGIIRVRDASELRDALRSLVRLKDMKGPRVGVLTPSGAGGIMATDACEDFGLSVGKLPEGLDTALKKELPEWVQIGNPIDIWPVGMLGGGYAGAYRQALDSLLSSPDLDAVLAISLSMNSPLHDDIKVADIVAAARKESAGGEKPVAMWIYGKDTAPVVQKLETVSRVACFDSIEQAVRGLAYVYRYAGIRERRIPGQRIFSCDRAKAESLLARGRKEKILLGEDAIDLLSAFGIGTATGKRAGNLKEIVAAAEALSYPLVLKLAGEAFLHKSEWGGVITGIRNKKELCAAWRKIKENVRRRNPKLRTEFQVQKQVQGKELLLGLKLDRQFGHILACGLGGIYTEVFKDISRELVPVGRKEAEEMLSSLKILPLLKGVRGEAGVDWEGLVDILERLSFLAAAAPDIAELDINPLIADAAGCLACDARIIW